MAWMEGCTGCGKTNVTLRKIKDGPRICNDCKEKLQKNKQLARPDGSGKLILRGNVVTFIPAVKSEPIVKEVE